MKLIFRVLGKLKHRTLIKSFLLMKLSILTILLTGFQCIAASSSGQEKVSLNLRDMPIEQALKVIERQTNYSFFYKNESLSGLRVKAVVKDATVDQALEELLQGTGLRYQKTGNRMVTIFRVPGRQQAFSWVLNGKVINVQSAPIAGASVAIKGTQRGASTGNAGEFMIEIDSEQDSLVVTAVGYKTKTLAAGTERNMVIVLEEDLEKQKMDEVVITAFGQKQRKEAVVGSVTTVDPSTLRVPSSNLTTALAGRIAGVIAYQRSGEPGADDAQFFVRGVTTFGTGKANPLILIDGVEMETGDLSRLTVDDIASFSVMKDANATALYGARGANGVILVTTKEGKQGAAQVKFRAEGSSSSPTENVRFADPVTFMKLQNEAVRTRVQGTRLPYDESKIYYTAQGTDPVRYPAIDWQKILLDKVTYNQRYNLNVSGGGKVARYYIAAAYTRDNGIIKMDKRQNFNNNIQINRYSLRSNVNVNLTSTTEAVVRLSGTFDNYQGPLDGGTGLYNKAVLANPVYFLPYYEPDSANIYTKHILFGNTAAGNYLNPYADMVKGYRTDDRSSMYIQFGLNQNLNFITKGLSARAMYNINRFADLEVKRQYIPFTYALAPVAEIGAGRNGYRLMPLNPNTGTDYLDYVPSPRTMNNSVYFEAAVNYDTRFGNNSVSGMLLFNVRENKNGSYDDLQSSLPQRNAGLAGRLTYGYDNRYFVEANFGYNGSERFSQEERWGLFPSVGAGWVVSNEKFWEPMKDIVSKLKLKGTYGLVGNDAIGDIKDRFYYLSNVNMNDGGRGFSFGENFGYSRSGISISRYSDPLITWEVSQKSNYGVELTLLRNINIQADYFVEKRSKILQLRADIPTTMGLQASPKANIGKANGQGIDISLDYTQNFSQELWAVVRGNFTYASSRFELYEEPDYAATPWRFHKGQKISQRWGYIAERYFLDDEEVANSPVQTFGEYKAGDIKYKDINNDGRVDENDMVPIGYPTTPEIIYGFGLSIGYKKFDFNCFFQGSALSSFWIDPAAVAPFGTNKDITGVQNRAVLQAIADSYWSEDTRDIFAFWPRLSATNIDNNTVSSTWWMRNGAFLRMKTAEIGYTMSRSLLRKIGFKGARIYASGNNLFQIRNFKLWDPEQAGNAFNYPVQRVVNLGINLEL
ncbi:MAG: SusC/RagA family TonB-linked outer membrane protein [Niabella sp.]|nr:SusC/RagA family TonB-linked outer membrane protein [Niabella sp.]